MSALPNLPPGISLNIDNETIKRVDDNLRLAERFIDMLFDDPTTADDIPAEAYVIFLPDDDPDLASRHAAAGEQMRAAGRIAHFVRV